MRFSSSKYTEILTVLPRPLASFQGAASWQGRGGQEKEGRGEKGKGREGEGKSSPFVFTI